MSSCMQASQWLSRPGGPQLITDAIYLATQGCRRDIECECLEVNEDGVVAAGKGEATWWDTNSGLFTGPGQCDNDREFMEMRAQSVAFLDRVGAIERHPQKPHLIRFI